MGTYGTIIIRNGLGVPDWPDAACKGEDTELFFPAGRVLAVKAKQICASCPVRNACLDWALGNTEIHGIWGGMTEEERKLLRRVRRMGTH